MDETAGLRLIAGVHDVPQGVVGCWLKHCESSLLTRGRKHRGLLGGVLSDSFMEVVDERPVDFEKVYDLKFSPFLRVAKTKQ